MKPLTKNTIYKFILVFAFCAIFFCFPTVKSQAAAKDYHLLTDEKYQSGTIYQHGNYYFQLYDQTLYMSTNRNNGYKSTGIPAYYNTYTNGKNAYYVFHNTLYKYDFSSKKNIIKKIRNLQSVISYHF